ncbi:GNAT family N-acetyltransferase [Luteimonas terricola]|uniref:GNAT family N-acetyltransferase n=1 Tax=Luteimonas terricola TaxID=645597 RepID=UPI00227AD6F2|nr:GNAT family protein [Luteimonas terricola]
MGSGDRALYCALYGCADTMGKVGAPMHAVEAAAAFDRVLRLLDRRPARCGYWLLPGGEGPHAPGGILALLGDDAFASAEVGVLLAPAAQRSGVATAAITALADAVFAATALRRLWTRHAPGHEAAAALMRRTGFTAMRSAPGEPCRWEFGRDDWLARGPVSFAAWPSCCST